MMGVCKQWCGQWAAAESPRPLTARAAAWGLGLWESGLRSSAPQLVHTSGWDLQQEGSFCPQVHLRSPRCCQFYFHHCAKSLSISLALLPVTACFRSFWPFHLSPLLLPPLLTWGWPVTVDQMLLLPWAPPTLATTRWPHFCSAAGVAQLPFLPWLLLSFSSCYQLTHSTNQK
jgi:hypothetical protein